MKIFKTILAALAMLLLLNCSGGVGVKFQIDETYVADWDGEETAKNYSQYTVDALEEFGPNLLDPDLKVNNYKRFCPKYNELVKDQKRRFWLMMISSLSWLESGFDPKESFGESFTVGNDSDDNVVSRGLMQMSIDSVKSSIYKCDKKAGIKSAKDLYNPQKNLRCAVIIMNHWVGKDKKLYGYRWRSCNDGSDGCRTWYGVGRYWSPVRLERYQNRNLTSSEERKYDRLKNFSKKTRSLGFCGS
jgi:hypothetical protein